MNFASTIVGTAERVPLPDVIMCAAIHRLCSRTATSGVVFDPNQERCDGTWAHNRVSPENGR